MEVDKQLDERVGWGYFWINSEWKLHFFVLTPGLLRIFSCDKRTKIEKNVSLSRCFIGLHKPFQVMQSKQPKHLIKKHAWKYLMKLATSDKTLSTTDLTVITIKPRREKSCFLMFTSQEEAETWKAGIEESAATANKETVKSWRKSKTFQQASDVLDQTRVFFQTNSLLKIPFGLRWEAYPPLFKIKASRPPTTPAVFQGKIDNNSSKVVHQSKMDKPLWQDLSTLSGCTYFLRSSYLNLSVLEQASIMVDYFKGSYQMGDSSLPNELRLEAWKGTIQRIVKALVDGILSNNPSMESCNHNEEHMDQLVTASEIWVFGAVHDKIMGACKQMFAVQDASMDNILAKLERVDPLKLGVRAEFEMLVLGQALDEFRMLNRLRSPYEKALCLQKTVKCIVDGINSLIKSCGGGFKDTDALLPCTDDLLSFMILLMARAKVKYLHANACYMENFITLQKETYRGELMYHITNFHAACTFLQSIEVHEIIGDIKETLSPPAIRQTCCSHDDSRSSSSSLSKSTSNSADEGSSRTQLTITSSRNDSLDSDANYPFTYNSKWEDCSEKSSSGRDDWRTSDSLNDGDSLELNNIIDCPFGPNTFCRVDFEESHRNNMIPSTGKSMYVAIPGGSPDFLLASTYQ